VLRREEAAPPLLRLSWRPMAAALVMGLAMLLVYPLGGDFGWLVATVVAPLAYGIALWVVGAFGPEERALVRRVLGRS